MNHDVFGKLHVLEHALQLAGEGSSTLCDMWRSGWERAVRGARPRAGPPWAHRAWASTAWTSLRPPMRSSPPAVFLLNLSYKRLQRHLYLCKQRNTTTWDSRFTYCATLPESSSVLLLGEKRELLSTGQHVPPATSHHGWNGTGSWSCPGSSPALRLLLLCCLLVTLNQHVWLKEQKFQSKNHCGVKAGKILLVHTHKALGATSHQYCKKEKQTKKPQTVFSISQ